MAKSAIITLTTAGADTGPFNLLSDADSYVTPFETNVAKSSLVSGYTSNLVPDAATIVRVQSSSSLCTNFINLTYPTTTTTTTTTSTTTTTTTAVTELYVYARYVNAQATLRYNINGSGDTEIGLVAGTSCNYIATITGLNSGDTVNFYTAGLTACSGNTSTCPVTSGCTTSITIVGGANYFYITVDGSLNC